MVTLVEGSRRGALEGFRPDPRSGQPWPSAEALRLQDPMTRERILEQGARP